MASMQRLIRTALRVTRRAARQSRRAQRRARRREGTSDGSGYPGDYQGTPTLTYQPVEDDRPDPGEVVWAWVPYEEDHSQGKDRPVLVIGRDGDLLLALQSTLR